MTTVRPLKLLTERARDAIANSSMNKKSAFRDPAFFNLRVLIASFFCLAGIFTLLLAAG